MNIIEIAKNIFTLVGGTTVVVGGTLIFCRTLIEKYIHTAIEKTANEQLEKTKNKLAKSMTAYEALLKKEFEYYQYVDKIYAELIVNIQDWRWYILDSSDMEHAEKVHKLKEVTLGIIKRIPELKNYDLVYSIYVPLEIFQACNKVVVSLQSNLDYFTEYAYKLYNKENVDEERIKEIEEDILRSISFVNVSIRDRLEKLSNAK